MWNEKKQVKWMDLIFDFWYLAKERFENEMKRRKKVAIKKLLAFIFLVLGSVYLLNGISQGISVLLGSDWLGPLVLGILLVAIGSLIGSKNY